VRQVVTYNGIPCYRVDSAIETHLTDSGEQVEVPVIRVVGFFEDTIAKIVSVLNSEFELYEINSGKSNDSFAGSLKVYQAMLRANRMELPEYKILEAHKFDVHVSSILQDVYGAMHRSLAGPSSELPETIKRDFYRIGAFLEMADIEFIKIRNRMKSDVGTNDSLSYVQQVPVLERSTTVVNDAVATEPIIPEETPVSEPENVITATETNDNTSGESTAEIHFSDVIAEHISDKKAGSDDRISHIEKMDMSVDSFDALGMSINSVNNTNGTADNDYFDLLTSSSVQKPTDSYDLLSSQQNAPAKEEKTDKVIPIAETGADAVKDEANDATANTADENKPAKTNGTPSDGVSLNIDKIDTFNMNVSGMIERTTEIIREGATSAENIAIEANTEQKNEGTAGPVNMDENAHMNDAMLREFVMSSKVVKEVDKMIAERAGAKINDEVDIEGDVERLRFLKVFTLKQLLEKITDNKDDIVAFAEKWIGKDNGGSFDSGICLFYLEYLLVGKRNDPAFSVEYVLKFISDNDYSARYIIPTYNAVRHAAGEPASSNFAHLTLK